LRKRALIAGCDEPFWKDVMLALYQRQHLEPVLWVASPRRIEELQQIFPDTRYRAVSDAVKGCNPVDAKAGGIVTPALLHDLSECSVIALHMMDRIDPGGAFLYAERIRHYYRLLAHWMAMLDIVKPDIVIFPESPHMVYDYVLYILCRRRGIPTLMFGSVAILGRVVPMGGPEAGYEVIGQRYAQLLRDNPSCVELVADLEQSLDKIKKDYANGKPDYIKTWERKNYAGKRDIKKLVNLHKYPTYAYSVLANGAKSVRDSLQKFAGFSGSPENYLKIKDRKIEESGMRSRQWYGYKRHANRKKQRLKNLYETMSVSPDTGKQNYVFTALHYQPERSTSPEGGIYVDQRMMVDNLARKIPEDWVLYVKENPLQFQQKVSHGERAREEWFYEDINSYPNVSFVALDSDPFTLIDRSRAVATIVGTVGWEALIRNKPVLVFGYSWYNYCSGVFSIASERDLDNAMASIQKGVDISERDIRLYLKALGAVSFPGFTNNFNRVMATVDNADNSRNYISAIEDYINKCRTKE
jgi:hypothetical protein